MANTKEQIREFIFENYLFDGDDDALKNDDSFMDEGIIDSTGILELVEWIEDTFGVKVDDTELVPENLDSVDKLEAFIAKKNS